MYGEYFIMKIKIFYDYPSPQAYPDKDGTGSYLAKSTDQPHRKPRRDSGIHRNQGEVVPTFSSYRDYPVFINPV